MRTLILMPSLAFLVAARMTKRRHAMNTTTACTRLVLVLALLVSATFAATSTLACVVGTGTSASCTEAELDACLPGGGGFDGTVTFNCGGTATIIVTSTKTSADTTSFLRPVDLEARSKRVAPG